MTLDEIACSHTCDKGSWAHGYATIYSRYFDALRQEKIHLLEIGVQRGSSIKTWLDFFPNASIAGIDVANDFPCSDPRFVFAQMDQRNGAALRQFNPFLSTWDVVVDDGCHCADAIAASFDALWPRLSPKGLFVIEDWFATLHPAFGNTSMGKSWLTVMVEQLNMYGKKFYGNPTPDPSFVETEFQKSLDFIHLYRGLVIIGKK